MSVEPQAPSPPLLLFIGMETKLAQLLDVALSRRGYRVAFARALENAPTAPDARVVFLERSIAIDSLKNAQERFPTQPIAALSERVHDPEVNALGTDAVISLSQPFLRLLSETERLLARSPAEGVPGAGKAT